MGAEERPGVRPCVGSGYCCLKSPCFISVQIYGVPELLRLGRCPDLRWDEDHNRYFCRQAENSEDVKELLGAGVTGCCSPLNTWRSEVRHRPEAHYPGYPQETG